jgi:hypothetical protein
MKKLILILLFVTLLSSCSNNKTLLAIWTEPTSGSEVQTYKVQVYRDGHWLDQSGKFVDDTTFSFEMSIGETIMVRVLGVDKLNRSGPWSENSILFIVEE